MAVLCVPLFIEITISQWKINRRGYNWTIWPGSVATSSEVGKNTQEVGESETGYYIFGEVCAI